MKSILVFFSVLTLLSCPCRGWAEEIAYYTYKNRSFVSKGSFDKDALKHLVEIGDAKVKPLSYGDMDSVEKALIRYLFTATKAEWESESTQRNHEEVLLNYGSYFLQFVPLSINGVSMIHIRGGRIEPDTFEGELIFALDGGSNFWSVNFYPSSTSFVKWRVNNEF